MSGLITANYNRLKTQADWKLLLFLVLFMDVKLAVKVVAIVLIYLLRFDFKFGFRFKNSRLPLFYVLVIGIAVFNTLIHQGFVHIKYNLVFVSGIGLWLMCILAVHQVKLAVENNTTEVLHRTLLVFFLLNAAVSLITLAHIIWMTKAINPYLYQGMRQKYFIGTGDFIKGLTFDVSITNSVICALGVIYFLFRKNAPMLLLSVAVLLLTGSNSLNILVTVLLAIIFIFQSTRDQKSLIVASMMFLIVFSTKISPQNVGYILHTWQRITRQPITDPVSNTSNQLPLMQRPDSSLTPDEHKQKIAMLYLDSEYKAIKVRLQRMHKNLPVSNARLFIPQPNLNDAPYQEATDTTNLRLTLLNFTKEHKSSLPLAGRDTETITLPGKIIALKQTTSFLLKQPQKILTGDGLGNFSSKIAFKATALGFSGGYPAKYAYITPEFMTHHLDVYLNFFSRIPRLHSVINSPNSVYLQLLGEYGLIGLTVFFVFYLGYFLKHYKLLSYGIPVLALILCVFWLEYWFEQLSVMILVELLLLVNIKDAGTKILTNDGN